MTTTTYGSFDSFKANPPLLDSACKADIRWIIDHANEIKGLCAKAVDRTFKSRVGEVLTSELFTYRYVKFKRLEDSVSLGIKVITELNLKLSGGRDVTPAELDIITETKNDLLKAKKTCEAFNPTGMRAAIQATSRIMRALDNL